MGYAVGYIPKRSTGIQLVFYIIIPNYLYMVVMFNNDFSPVSLLADVSKLLMRSQFTSATILALLQ